MVRSSEYPQLPETEILATRQLSPILVTVVAFWHFAVIRGLPLTPAVAFTSVGSHAL
jgi:hypothetical protein